MDQFLRHDLLVVLTAIVAAVGTTLNGLLIKSLTLHINSRMDAFIEEMRATAFQKGRADGIESERRRVPDLPRPVDSSPPKVGHEG